MKGILGYFGGRQLSFEDTTLWKRSLASQKRDALEEPRTRLRDSYLRARENTSLLVAEIRADLPQYTVHDITHIDGLWEYADLILGDVVVTPTEAFVLGLSFLLHDAGMSVAAYPGRLADVKALPIWADTYAAKVVSAAKQGDGQADARLEREATEDVLRLQHAVVAKDLGVRAWGAGTSHDIHLISDPTLRSAYGAVAGEVASSHWDTVFTVSSKLNREMGTPPSLPPAWTVDLLKVAFALRASDAAQVDARRAPPFLRLLSALGSESEKHWLFQSLLNRPILAHDRLAYSASRAFTEAEADAWWLCHDTLRMVDGELRQIDSALADAHRNFRFRAKGVANVESAATLTRSIPVSGWAPIDASIRIGNIPSLVTRLGGAQLYGDDPIVAVRELIQNACDAVRARRTLENRPSDWGRVTISLSKDRNGSLLVIADNGIGMTADGIASGLLDFGSSYWSSELSRRELPTLASRGFQSTGKFGIGFFSVFILGEEVRVLTRRPSAAATDAISLTFSSGVLKRPLLAFGALPNLEDGGTRVEVRLKEDVAVRLSRVDQDMTLKTFSDRIRSIAPACDVDIVVKGRGAIHLKANSWRTCPAEELVLRGLGDKFLPSPRDVIRVAELSKAHSRNVRDVVSPTGQYLGRGFINVREFERYYDLNFGSSVVGGLAAGELSAFGGIFLGSTDVVTRTSSHLIGEVVEYYDWAREQVRLLSRQGLTWVEGASLIDVLLCMGIEDVTVPCVLSSSGPITVEEFERRVATLDHILMIQDASYSLLTTQLRENEGASEDLVLLENAFVTQMGTRGVRVSNGDRETDAWGDYRDYATVDIWLVQRAMSVWGQTVSVEDLRKKQDSRVDSIIGHVGGREMRDGCYRYERGLPVKPREQRSKGRRGKSP